MQGPVPGWRARRGSSVPNSPSHLARFLLHRLHAVVVLGPVRYEKRVRGSASQPCPDALLYAGRMRPRDARDSLTLRVDGFESAEWSSGSIESSDADSIRAQRWLQGTCLSLLARPLLLQHLSGSALAKANGVGRALCGTSNTARARGGRQHIG